MSGRSLHRLVAVGPRLPRSGFTRVLESVLAGLGPSWETHYLGLGYKGPVERRGRVLCHPCNLHGGDVFGAFAAADWVERHRASALLLLNDLWMLGNYRPVLERVQRHARVLAYVPVDGRIVDAELAAPLLGLDRIVAYNRFGSDQLEGALDALGAAHRPSVEALPHGVDADTFRPLDADPAVARRLGRAALPWLAPLPQDAFIVLNANRPVPRKRIDLTIAGFAAFRRKTRLPVYLYLHHALLDPSEEAQILRWADAHGVGDRLLTTPRDAIAHCDDTWLNHLYNACDVGVNTAEGEGWGLVAFEHAAAGAAQVVPGHSACKELWTGDAAELLPVRRRRVPREYSLLELAEVGAEDLAAALLRLAEDPEHLRRMGTAARANAARPEYRWEAIAGRWSRLLHGTLGADALSG